MVEETKLEQLYRTTTDCKLPTGETVYLRVLSAFDQQARDEAALMAQGEMRRKLRDHDSPEYLKALDWLEDAEDKDLIDTICNSASPDFVREAAKEIQPRLIPMPEEPTTEEKLDTLERRKDEEDSAKNLREEFVKTKLSALRSELEKLPHDKLLGRARRERMNLRLYVCYVEAINDYTLNHVAFADPDCKAKFPVGLLDADLRQYLLRKYNELDSLRVQDLYYFFSTAESKASAKNSNPQADSAQQGE